MWSKIWKVLVITFKVLRSILTFGFYCWLALSIISIENSLANLRYQNLQMYNLQAEVYTSMISTISKVVDYIKQVNDESNARDVAIDNNINKNDKEHNKKIKAVENKVSVNDLKIEQYIALNSKRYAILIDDFNKYVEHPSYEYIKSMIVFIVQPSIVDENHGSIGTGTIVKVTDTETFILTNKHVCDFESPCYVYENKNKYQLTLIKQNEVDHDVQLVKINKVLTGKQAVKGIKDVVPQDKVYMVGHNNGNPFLYSEGTVSGFDKWNGNLIVGMPSGPGNSGSGIFTQDGYLTGLLYAGQIFEVHSFPSLDTAHGLCVSSKVLRLFLKGYTE
jgi:hypothetical protein